MLYFILILGIPVAVINAYIGLRRLVYLSLAFVAGFASVSCVKGIFWPTVDYFSNFFARWIALVLSFLILTITPAMAIMYLGRKLIVRLEILENMSPIIDSLLGMGYGTMLYAAIASIVWR